MRTFQVIVLLSVCLLLVGCSGNKKLLVEKDNEIIKLQGEVGRLSNEVVVEEERANKLDHDLKSALSDLEETELICMEEREGCERITISDAATFSSGATALTRQGKEIIDRIWAVLDEYPDRGILIEGHTDNEPIAQKFRDRFQSNWDLSVARALSVLHYVAATKSTDMSRIGVIGYGEYRPIEENSTPEGRKKNRRVVITIRDYVE